MNVYAAGGGECVGISVPTTTSGYCQVTTTNNTGAAQDYRFIEGPAMLVPPMTWPERERMRGLYEVFIIDPEVAGTDALLFTRLVVANDDHSAKMKAWRAAELLRDPDDLDFVARFIGNVRAKAKG